MLARGPAVDTASGDVTMSDPGTTELVWALISGDEKVKYPACDGRGESEGRMGFLRRIWSTI